MASTLRNLLALAKNTIVVYLLYAASRLLFLICNWGIYADDITFGHTLSLFVAGLRFDTTAILYSNIIFVVMFMLPLHIKETKAFYNVARWLYVVLNSICLCANLCDCAYFPYTGKRTTFSVFSEFANEGGNMVNIIGEQVIDNWYLLIVLGIFAIILWKAFCAGTTPNKLAPYYIGHTATLALLIPLCIGGMRGGFTTAIRPITISDANKYTNRPSESALVLNTPFSIFRTLSKKALKTPNYMSEEEAEAVYSPLHTPCDSTTFRAKNVVVMIMESFGMQHIGFYNDGEGRTPFLDSLITTSARTFKYSFANGRKSIEGMPSVLSSLPNFVEPLFLTPASLNDLSGLARCLSEEKGYTSAFFHGAENGSMGFEAFAKATGFQKYYGRTEYNQDARYNGDADYDGTWAIWDEEFLQFYADKMSEMQEPFMTSVFTASSHTPFAIPERYKGRFAEGEDPLEPCIEYSDNALRNFFGKAKEEPWFNNTIFVITADHTSKHFKPRYKTTTGTYMVPIIIYAPGDSTICGYDEEQIAEQVDIMPTIMTYLGYDKPYVAFGRDVLSTNDSTPLALHWVPEFGGYEYIEGDYALHFDGQNVIRAYRYKTDISLSENILAEIEPEMLDAMTTRMKSFIQQYMQRINTNNLIVRE